MSASPAGKFQDHYSILGVDPKADSAAIQQAYSKLAQKYYPNNVATGNAEMFAAINAAYECLSDPQLREIFDKLKGVGQEAGNPKFSGAEFFEGIGHDALRRTAILCVLYDRRRSKPSTPSLSMRNLELIVDLTAEQLGSALWYLKQRGLAASDDKSSLQITVDGMDYLERLKPSPEDVMALIREEAIASIQVHPGREEQPGREGQSALSTLNRALTQV